MKKLISIVAVLVFCLSLACPVFAAEGVFVPSISEKNGPQIVPGKDADGNPYLGVITDDEDKVWAFVHDDCLVVTPISKAKTSTEIPEDAREQLISVYDQLQAGSMKLPYDKFSSELDPSKMVIRELVDITWTCDEHPLVLEPGKNYLELVFDLGVGADTDVYVMAYVDGQWNPIVSTVNNGDGTITCQFDAICPVAFAVPAGSSTYPPQTGDNANLTLWIVLLAVSAMALAAVVVVRRKVAR